MRISTNMIILNDHNSSSSFRYFDLYVETFPRISSWTTGEYYIFHDDKALVLFSYDVGHNRSMVRLFCP